MADYMQGDHDKSIAVPFSDDESPDKPEELLDEDKPEASPEERIERRKKRNERITTILREGKKNAEENRALREEQEGLKQQLAELRGAVVASRAPANDNRPDPYEAQLDAVYARQQEAYAAAQAEIKAETWTPERQKHYEKLARQIETDKIRIHNAQAREADTHARRAESAQQVWVQKYPDVYNNARAYQYAEASYKRRLALLEPGQAPTNDMVDEVMNDAITTFKLGPKKTPSASEKSRLSGVASSGNGGGGGGGRGELQMTPVMRAMAVAAYSDLPETEAIKTWANKEGKRLRDKKVL